MKKGLQKGRIGVIFEIRNIFSDRIHNHECSITPISGNYSTFTNLYEGGIAYGRQTERLFSDDSEKGGVAL